MLTKGFWLYFGHSTEFGSFPSQKLHHLLDLWMLTQGYPLSIQLHQ